jgi:hypothetical protein
MSTATAPIGLSAATNQVLIARASSKEIPHGVFATAVVKHSEIGKRVELHFNPSENDPTPEYGGMPYPDKAKLPIVEDKATVDGFSFTREGNEPKADMYDEKTLQEIQARFRMVRHISITVYIPAYIKNGETHFRPKWHGLLDAVMKVCSDTFPKLYPNKNGLLVHPITDPEIN